MILNALIDLIGREDSLCLLPIERVLIEEPGWLSTDVAIFPPESIDPQSLRVVDWPEQTYQRELGAGEGGTFSGDGLQWIKSAATRLDLPDFFGSALIGFPMPIDWGTLWLPQSHESHLGLLRASMERAERTLDLVRFELCDLVTLGKLPGRAGLLAGSSFSTALFYAQRDHESTIIAGEVATHRLITGIGPDLTGVMVEPVGDGEVGRVVSHALRLYSEALEASTETSRFVQMLSLIEFLADPFDYVQMKTVKRLIGRHIAKDRKEYEAIVEDFRALTSEENATGGGNKGLRHNIVHMGARIEDLIDASTRKAVFQRLRGYASATIENMRGRATAPWSEIVAERDAAVIRLGLVA